ncbi:peroxidase [Marchantia polymorpha subsp. ruderalis]|uniref:Peroxidase n=2 Tax=Marchantia polymorpha TaxID=3197 RepID=A0A176VQ06_MARPO|nr:hypothetical protein AXG93_2318s1390 [Marchantia polymorpha subsp. ruderalis]PTQ32727.1 hypothetical protein MARPO_0096s0070 [Marchantia polymorpha]BBM97901.1 hypothetical protein Mp_1g09290 [Marchantia polymorpha subsp. ruderalis]|eukprot:PTQ32727.1 hypothetical protein MARPO_0096s0070 [Marchantia polymorpha]
MMAPGRSVIEFLVVALAISWQLTGTQAQLRADYYAATCPNAEAIARQAFIRQINIINLVSAPASILRLAFHDCAVDGCEGSIMLNSDGGAITDEKDAERNLGIGNLNVITTMKAALDNACPGVVSCADVIAMAGREAVNFAGGPQFGIQLGRRDGIGASTSHAQAQLLPADTSVTTLLNTFAGMGLNAEETVALLGSHTIGVSHCDNIRNRLYPQPDATLQSNVLFATTLRAQCPQIFQNPNTVVQMDRTNVNFDTVYFSDVMQNRGLLTIDDALGSDPRTSGFMAAFAGNRQRFFNVFAVAYEKMTRFGVLTGTQGQIRNDCTAVNP